MGNIGTGLATTREADNSKRFGAASRRDACVTFGVACADFVRFRVVFFLVEVVDLVVVDCLFLRTLVAVVLVVFLLVALLAGISISIPAQYASLFATCR